MDYTTFATGDIAEALAQIMLTHGRTPILTEVTEITDDNILKVLNRALSTYRKNANESQWLYDYYRGKQPIINRTKLERPEICNIVVENRAYEIVTFKTGRFLYKNIQYTNRNEDTIGEVNELNRIMYEEGKAGKDRELVDWFHIAGQSFRLVNTASDAPFHIYSVDPRRAFVVYSDTVEKEPVLGVYVTNVLDDNEVEHTIYTDQLGDVPLVEYPANYARLGCFEVVISLLNAINAAQSNRLDGVEQFIQALLVFKGLDMKNGDIADLRREGAICLPSGTDMDYLTKELNQSQVQTLVDDLYQAVLTICGMPNRNGGSSTSDTKGAVVLRDGWSAAATAVKETKQYFEASERRMLKMALKAFNIYRDAIVPTRNELTVADIDIHFDEGEYENMLEKSQVFTTLLNSGYVHPKDAFTFSNITTDPEAAYINGKEYHDEQNEKELSELNNVRINGQSNWTD